MLCSLSQEARGAKDKHLFLIPTKVIYVVESRSELSDCNSLVGRSKSYKSEWGHRLGREAQALQSKVQSGYHHPHQVPCLETA